MCPVYVTKPSLPPLDEYVELLKDIWERQWLTNQGHYHEELEKALAAYLCVPYISLFCNGMIALQVGLQALRITGEVITTPFSFPATTHALYWNHCTPVFCDVDPLTGNLDPSKVESLITPRTTAILPVHVYGTPCDVDTLARIADTYGLKLFYDAAHTFGVKRRGVALSKYGDLAMLSFHATKVFNTAEGGALITSDPKLKQRIDYLKNFGFADEVTVVAPGTNGKMNELSAALGLVQLRHVDEAIAARRELAIEYRGKLGGVQGLRLLPELADVTGNYSYMPMFLSEQYPLTRDQLYEELKANGYSGRRYFYPLITEFPTYRGLPSSTDLPVAMRISREVLCLPIYEDLGAKDVQAICDIILAPKKARATRSRP